MAFNPLFCELEMNLSLLDHPRWSDVQKIKDLVASFLRNGFEATGVYQCEEIPSLIISGFVHSLEQLTGVIYDHPTSGIWVDVYVQYTDGGSLTVSNASLAHELDPMPQQTKIYSKGSSVDELLERVLSERKKEGRVTITKEEFPSHFEDQYQKEMKWRIDREGPTSLEIKRIAYARGESLDNERLQTATWKIKQTWLKEKNKPKKTKSRPCEFVLPEEFQQPETFRRKLEQMSAPIPQLNVPVLPVYLVLISALAYWCYYGYQYNQTHFPVSLTALVIFFSVFLVLFLLMMTFREYCRRVRMCPLLKRMADLRSGAFLVITGTSPSLFYAREKWLGKVSFREGSEHENASTRLDAIMKYSSMGSLAIHRNTFINKVFSDKDTIPLPESEFSRKFAVSGTDVELTTKLLNPTMLDTVVRLDQFGRPQVEINGNSVGVEIENDLSNPRKEAVLRKFLEEAERIIEATIQQAGQPESE